MLGVGKRADRKHCFWSDSTAESQVAEGSTAGQCRVRMWLVQNGVRSLEFLHRGVSAGTWLLLPVLVLMFSVPTVCPIK